MSQQLNQAYLTAYRDGVFRMVKQSGLISYFTAFDYMGAVYSSPRGWCGTLNADAPCGDHAQLEAICAQRAVRWLLSAGNLSVAIANLGGLVVDEEFFLSYDAEMPEGWPS